MKASRQNKATEAAEFSVEEHLRVQKEIEKRAHALWVAGGCRPSMTLHDWLQAEREILEEFYRTRSKSGTV